MEAIFTQKWIEDILKEFFQKDILSSEDLEQIQYMKIGDDFGNGFYIEVSKEEPPVPFSDPMGGDEWECCVLNEEQIKVYVDKNISDNFSLLFNNNGPYELVTSPIGIGYEYDEFELETEDLEKGEKFAKTVFKKEYCEKIDDMALYDEWYENTMRKMLDDMALFPNIKVLRIQSGLFEDFSFLDSLGKLETLELNETQFETVNGFEKLANLKQLSCWID